MRITNSNYANFFLEKEAVPHLPLPRFKHCVLPLRSVTTKP